MNEPRPISKDRAALAFWNSFTILGPLAGAVLPFVAGSLLGAFDHFRWDRPLTFLSAFCILGTMLFPLAAFLYARGGLYRARAHASRSWPVVHGQVEQSKIESKASVAGSLYRLNLTYRYVLNGVDYEGDTAEIGPLWIKNKALIERLAQRFPAGAKVAVHYDPEDPESSVLETSDEMAGGRSWIVWILAGAPFAYALVASIANAR